MALPRKKIVEYTLNGILLLIILVLFIPSWRIRFQGFFQSFFMPDVNLSQTTEQPLPENAINWVLFDTSDQLHNFADFKGKPIVLSFWATWCPPCRAELPELHSVQNKMNGQINVVAVSEESTETIRESGLNESYTFLYSTTGIPAFFNVASYPTLVIIDSRMNLVFRSTGAGHLDTPENLQFLKSLIQPV